MSNNEENFLGDMSDFFDSQHHDDGVATVIRQTNGDKNEVLEKFYAKLEELGLNLEELKPILEADDHTLIMSGAGAGKTTTIILKIIRDLLSGKMMTTQTVNSVYGLTHVQVPAKILVSTFLKTGAQDLQASLREWCEKLGIVGVDYSSIQFKTIHAEVKDAITKMGARVNILLDTQQYVRSVANKYSIRGVNATTRTISIDEVNELATIMAYARNRLDNKRYEHPLAQDYGLNALMLDSFLHDFKLFRQSSGGMDFEDMQEMLLDAIRDNPNVEQFVLDRYDYVFVDEFQDVSQLQYALLKYYFKGSTRTIIVGDSDQSIYSFRGSDSNIILNVFRADFNPTVLHLTTNYRCASNILNFVKPSIVLNGSEHSKELRSSKEGGEVNVIYNGDVNQLVTSIKSDMVRNWSVGILARTNNDLLIPAIILELDGNINFALSKSVNLNGRMAKQIIGMIDLVTKRITGEFETLLRTFLRKYDWYEADKLVNVLNANKGVSLYNISDADLKYSVPTLYPFLRGLRQAYEVDGVTAFLYILGVLETSVYTGESTYVQKARDLTSLISKLIQEHASLKELGINEIDVLFRSTLPERLARRTKFSTQAPVKLTTVHEAKGKEWDSVYIWNNVEGSFPNKVGNREMTEDEFEEERRVHYIASTRAKKKLTNYTSIGKMGTFLTECDLTNINSSINEDDSKETKVFKRKHDTSFVDKNTKEKARGYVTEYHEKVFSSGNLVDERVANLQIVINVLSLQGLVDEAHNNYNVGKANESQEIVFSTLDNICTLIADRVLIEGAYR